MQSTSPRSLGSDVRLPSGVGGFFSGALSVVRGAGKIFADGGLRKLATIPLLLTAVLYVALIVASFFFADDVLEKIWTRPEEGFLKLLWYVLLPIVFVGLLAPFALLFSTVAEAVGGPFYDRMAVRVLADHSIDGKEPGLWRGTIPDVIRSLALTAAGAACSLLAFIPGIGIGFALLGTVIACLGFASSALNSSLMVTGVGVRGRIAFMARSFAAMFGIGAVVAGSLLVPFLGLLAIPSAVVGATDLYARALIKR
jgi:CysZ protein